MSSSTSTPGSVNLVFSTPNAQGGTSFKFNNSPYQNVSAKHITGLGVTAYKRFHPPIISNANLIDREEGLVAYDQDTERLCYTDADLIWRCVAITDDLGAAGDFMSAMLLVTNTIGTSVAGYTLPVAGYTTLANWTTTAPLVANVNWSNATGIYTVATAGRFLVQAQVSWRETGANTGVRVARIIHTDTVATTTIMCETVTNPSPNKNINTVQNLSAGILAVVGDTIRIEVAQTSGSSKDVEGGGTVGSSGTVLQISRVV